MVVVIIVEEGIIGFGGKLGDDSGRDGEREGVVDRD